MSDNSPFLVLKKSCDEAIEWFTEQITHIDMQVIRTFDLQTTRHENSQCPCPHHGTDQCSCQMVVLLVYRSGHQPISVIAHGYDHQTWFCVVDNPQQRPDPRLEADIWDAVVTQMWLPINISQEPQPHEHHAATRV